MINNANNEGPRRNNYPGDNKNLIVDKARMDVRDMYKNKKANDMNQND